MKYLFLNQTVSNIIVLNPVFNITYYYILLRFYSFALSYFFYKNFKNNASITINNVNAYAILKIKDSKSQFKQFKTDEYKTI